jgi:hypothetical protein
MSTAERDAMLAAFPELREFADGLDQMRAALEYVRPAIQKISPENRAAFVFGARAIGAELRACGEAFERAAAEVEAEPIS